MFIAHSCEIQSLVPELWNVTSAPRKDITPAFSARGLERSDAELVQKCRSGDETAWNELVDRYQRLIYTIPRRAGLSESQAAKSAES